MSNIQVLCVVAISYAKHVECVVGERVRLHGTRAIYERSHLVEIRIRPKHITYDRSAPQAQWATCATSSLAV